MVQRHPLRPGRLTADIRDRGDLLGDAEHAVAVRRAQRADLASSGRALGSELPDCVEQPVPGVAVQLAVHADQGLVNQCPEQVEHLGRADLALRAHSLGHLQCPAVEYRQPAEQQLLGGIEQLVAPFHGGPQRLLARWRGPVAVGEQFEPVGQPGSDLLDRQGPCPGRRKLDRQRHAIKRAADVSDRGKASFAAAEVRPHGRSPLEEELNSLAPRHLAGVGDFAGRGLRQPQRGNPPDEFAADAERLAARRDHPQSRASGEQPLHEFRARLHQVLARVQDEQHGARAQRLGERVGQQPVGLLANAERRGHQRHDPAGLARGCLARDPGHQPACSGCGAGLVEIDIGQVSDPHPARILRAEHRAEPEREPGLADPARTAQRQRPDPAENRG